jgi:hypothetical protein
MTMTTIEQIQIQAMQCAQGHFSQGWSSPGADYDLGVYPGDQEALADRLGREPTKDERLTLERLIRVWLDAEDDDEASLRAAIEAASS